MAAAASSPMSTTSPPHTANRVARLGRRRRPGTHVHRTGLEIRRDTAPAGPPGSSCWYLVGRRRPVTVRQVSRRTIRHRLAGRSVAGRRFLALVKIVLTRTSTGTRPGTGEDADLLIRTARTTRSRLLAQARTAAAAHLTQHGKPITRDQLRAELRTGTDVATVLHRQVRQDTRTSTVPVPPEAFARHQRAHRPQGAANDPAAVTATPADDSPEPRRAPGLPHASTPGQQTLRTLARVDGVCVRPWPFPRTDVTRVDRGHRGALRRPDWPRSASRAPTQPATADPADPGGLASPTSRPSDRSGPAKKVLSLVRVRAHLEFERADAERQSIGTNCPTLTRR